MDIDTSDKREQRNFGLVMAVAFMVISLIRWWFSGTYSFIFIYIAVPFAVLGLLAPRVLQPVLVVWIKFSIVLNWIMTRVLLSLVFFLMITPTRIILSLRGKDTLNRSYLPGDETYWEKPEEQPDDIEGYKNQF